MADDVQLQDDDGGNGIGDGDGNDDDDDGGDGSSLIHLPFLFPPVMRRRQEQVSRCNRSTRKGMRWDNDSVDDGLS